MIKYDKLWTTMAERGVTKYYLTAKLGISPSQITRLKRNQNVSTFTLNRLCEILNCSLEDIAEYIPDNKD